MPVSVDPATIVFLGLLGGLYVRAVRVLNRRGVRVPARQQVAWYAGLALWAVALLSPVDPLSDKLFTAHMGQHLLIAELGAPLLLVGARSPVLLFLLPRPALVAVARRSRLRAALRTLRRPHVAVPVYTLVLFSWHYRPLFEGALRSEPLHALQHQSFVAISVLVWWSALEPERRHPRGELWKIGHIFAARMGGMFLGMAFLVMQTPAYQGFYGDSALDYGLTPLEDQQFGGGMMLTLDILIIAFALCFFFWNAARESVKEEQEQRARLLAAAAERERRGLPA